MPPPILQQYNIILYVKCGTKTIYTVHICSDHNSTVVLHFLVVTWARVVCLMCVSTAFALWAYISGKSQVPVLQLL